MFILCDLGYDMIIDCELVVLLYVLCSINTSAISTNINSIPMLTGTNVKKWRKHVMMVLGYMDLDLAIWTEPRVALMIPILLKK